MNTMSLMSFSQGWWPVPVISAPGMLGTDDDNQLRVSLGYLILSQN